MPINIKAEKHKSMWKNRCVITGKVVRQVPGVVKITLVYKEIEASTKIPVFT